MEKNIVIITPLRDEAENIDRLFSAIANQTINIYCWIIIENDSFDGSKEKLNYMTPPENVYHLIIHDINTRNEYQLGKHYSNIVNIGFNILKSKENIYENIDFIGILDADCFPTNKYFEYLIYFLNNNQHIGITSGIIKDLEGKLHSINDDHVRGSGRIWRKRCFEEAGYIVGLSADTLSSAKAIIRGWEVKPYKKAVMVSRLAGSKHGHGYYGRASYYRGNTFIYAMLRSMKQFLALNIREAVQFFYGYFMSYVKSEKRIGDKEILEYFRSAVKRKLKNLIKVKK